MAAIGQAMTRLDGVAKVTGAAKYAAEIPVANVAYAVMLGSRIGLGRVVSIDRSEAEKQPGVLAVYTLRNAPRASHNETDAAQAVERTLQLLDDDEVRYFHQPIALVVADSLEVAHHAASLLGVEYATRRAEVSLEDSRDRAFEPKAAGPVGHADSARGDPKRAFDEAEVKVQATYVTPAENHNPMEMHATTAVWQGPDHVTLYDATQGIFEVRRRVAKMLGLPKENVRVISHFLGGGFGCKGSVWSHVLLCALAARELKRPVKLMITRAQMFGPVGFRPRTIQEISLGAKKDGALTSLTFASTSQTSRFDQFVEPAAVLSRMLYACENVATSHRIVSLDTGTPTFMRAPGESSGSFGLESAMDELAYALRMDPIELRRKNHADEDGQEHKPFSSKSLRACYDLAEARFGWKGHNPEPRSMRRGKLLVGYGVATATYPAHLRPASAVARMNADGTARVEAGSQDLGTGTYTVMTQIAADALGLPTSHVRFELGDTEMPETPGSGGSQTAASTGSAVFSACTRLRDALIEKALADAQSPLFSARKEDVTTDSGAMVLTRDKTKRDTFADVVKRSGQNYVEAKADSKPSEDRNRFSTHSFGAQLCEVTVDEDLGTLRVARFVSAFACGTILNAKTARSQFLGGIVWGIGMALHERTIFDERTGRIVNHDLADYLVPTSADVPSIEVISVPEVDAHVNPIGVKGIGEIGITGVAAAIANAVHHATGKRIRTLPITVDQIL